MITEENSGKDIPNDEVVKETVGETQETQTEGSDGDIDTTAAENLEVIDPENAGDMPPLPPEYTEDKNLEEAPQAETPKVKTPNEIREEVRERLEKERAERKEAEKTHEKIKADKMKEAVDKLKGSIHKVGVPPGLSITAAMKLTAAKDAGGQMLAEGKWVAETVEQPDGSKFIVIKEK